MYNLRLIKIVFTLSAAFAAVFQRSGLSGEAGQALAPIKAFLMLLVSQPLPSYPAVPSGSYLRP